MRSSELAALAGVTIRTLRHYHQLGILAEPERASNGYREYDVHDLVRVLRIKRLSALGLPLQNLPSVLDKPDEDQDSVLERLDYELTAEITRLNGQRALIGQLRRERVAPDVPPELSRHLSAFAATGLSPQLVQFDREQAILLAHLAGEQGLPSVTRLYDHLAKPARLAIYSELNVRFDALDTDTDTAEVERLVDDVVAATLDVMREFGSDDSTIDLGAVSETLFTDYSRGMLNATQVSVTALIEARVAEKLASEGGL